MVNSVKKVFKDNNSFISVNEVDALKIKLNKSINKIQDLVEPLETCRNHTLILGSLEYMAVVMKVEQLELCYKKDLLQFISLYVSKVESILSDFENFIDIDLLIVDKTTNKVLRQVSVPSNLLVEVNDKITFLENGYEVTYDYDRDGSRTEIKRVKKID